MAGVYSFYLPFLYSCVSIVGVLLLLVCTPFGFVRLFTLVGEFVTRPQFLRDLDEEHNVARYQQCCGSGSAFILVRWIRIRIGNTDPDPGGPKLPTKVKKL
jgi:hypothetical protein